MKILFFLVLIFLGYCCFCLPIGILVFRMTSSRRTYSKKSFVDSASHTKDPIIMEPLLVAKKNWAKKPIEKVTVKAHAFWVTRLFFKNAKSKKNLSADLYMHENFESNKTIAILVHGFSDSSSGLAYLAESYYEQGISSLSINLFAHGESDGNYCSLGNAYADGLDIISWITLLRNRFGKDIKIILHGVSMGGATVIQSAFMHELPVSLVISDCAASDFSAQMKNSTKKFLPKGFITSIFVSGICFFASLSSFFITGFFFCQNRPKKVIEKARKSKYSVPTLFFHGDNDTLVTPQSAYEMYNLAPQPKKIFIIENAPHIGSWFYNKELYMSEIIQCL